MLRRRASKNGTDSIIRADDGSHVSDDKMHANGRRQLLSCGRFILITCLLSLLGLLLLAISGIDSTPSDFVDSRLGSSPIASSLSSVATKKDWSQCTQHNEQKTFPKQLPKLEKRDKVEPLWLPAYPTSLPGRSGSIYSSFLSALTGIDSASRNYYRSSKKLKRCHYLNNPNDTCISCEIVHPIVPCERPHPSAQSNNFGEVVLVALRNPITAFPAYQQEKAEKYHNAKGQVERSEWIAFRDQWVGNATHSPLFDEWKHFIMEWRGMDPYHVALYLPYEWWYDEAKGPALSEQLASVLQSQGLPVLYEGIDENNSNSPGELECIWHQKIREAMLAEETKLEDEGWYVPDYHEEQRNLIAAELDTFASEIHDGKPRPGDEQLIRILHEYRDSILYSNN